MIAHSCREVSAGFTNITSITTCTRKFIDHTRTYPYKLGLIKTLFHRTFKINNTWMGFHTDLQKLSVILRRNLFLKTLSTNIFLNIFRKQSREGKHSAIQESSPRKRLSSSLKSLTLGISQSRHRGVYANLLTGYVNLLI